MTSKLNELLSSTSCKPLPPPPRPVRTLKNLFPPRAQSPELPSPLCTLVPKALALSSSGSTTPLESNHDQLYIDQKRFAEVELENKKLRQANEVLFKQNSHYSDLLREYRTTKELLTRITDSVDVLGTIGSRARACQENIRRAEKEAVKDWKGFAETKKNKGVRVESVVADIVEDYTTEITVYKDYNMI